MFKNEMLKRINIVKFLSFACGYVVIRRKVPFLFHYSSHYTRSGFVVGGID